jgi:hypothetical protein
MLQSPKFELIIKSFNMADAILFQSDCAGDATRGVATSVEVD